MGSRLVFVLISGLVVLWWVQRSSEPPSQEVERAQVNHRPEVNPSSQPKPSHAQPSIERLSREQPSSKPKVIQNLPVNVQKNSWDPKRSEKLAEEGYVEFEVKDDWAIAYGDVLLGKVPAGGKVKQGHTQARKTFFWGGEIPIAINPKLPNPERVKSAIQYFHEYTHVRFIPFEGQEDAIIFEVGEEHCYSYLGRIGGHQPIFLSDKCTQAEILHELMHALGFIHEQSRTDRDQYVEILWGNIQEVFKPQFAKAPLQFMDSIKGTDFDYESAMLYRKNAFAISPELETIQSKGKVPITPSQGALSHEDIRRVNFMYP